MGKRRRTSRSASASRRNRSPIATASEAARDASRRPNSHPDRNLRPCRTMHRIGVKSQRRSRPGFRRFFLQRTPKERSVRPLISAGKSLAKANRNSKRDKTTRREGTTLLHLRDRHLVERSRRGRRHAKGSSLQFQERGLSPRQFPMRARAQDSAAQSCLGNGQQAALQELQEIE